ncbi:MAG: hypothetical protein NZL85_02545 [Fimbriimonadales bacterium]|nr:hypothetical protein [Fimbriimonadales bacterium]
MDEHELSVNEQEVPSEQAAVQMPSEPVVEPSDGVAGAPTAPPISDHHPALFEATAPFWQQPLPPRTYMEPPFYPNLHSPQTEQEVLEYKQYLRQAGYEAEAIDLGFGFHRLVQAAGYEYERLRHELEPVRLQLQEEIRQCERELEQKQNEFAEQMARARLPLPRSSRRSGRNLSEPLVITPHLVEDALTHDFATADEICGQHGVMPTSEREGQWATLNRIGQWLMELGAPLFAGLILGVNIAVITGFVRLEDFRQGRQMWLVVLAALIGFFIEKLVGTVSYHTASSVAQASERPFERDEAYPFPRLKSVAMLAFLGLLTLLLGAAVVTVDALGLRMLHEQEVQRLARELTELAKARPQIEKQLPQLMEQLQKVLPFWVYLIAGCVISLPYLIYKATMGWRQGEMRLRDARIAYLRWKHIEERRSEPEVQAAFRLAQEVVGLQQRRDSLKAQLQTVVARLDSARTQAVGSHQQFVQSWEAMRDRLIAQRDGAPFGRGGREIPFNRRALDEQPDTLLRRFMRAYRRD